jgi:hypothetical protein
LTINDLKAFYKNLCPQEKKQITQLRYFKLYELSEPEEMKKAQISYRTHPEFLKDG